MRSVVVMLVFSACSAAADPCVSGVPVGKRPGPYSFLVATGPQKGQQTCYICEQEDKPTAVVFARKLSDPLGNLLAKLDAEIPTRKDAGFKVWMTQLTEKAELDTLSDWAKKQALKNVPVGGFEDTDGPPAYKLATDADVTVLLFVKQKVVANFAYRDGELTEKSIGEVMKAVPNLFEKK